MRDSKRHIVGQGLALTSRSYHTGIVNVAFLDGSVRGVANSIDLQTWRALGTRSGGEIFGNLD